MRSSSSWGLQFALSWVFAEEADFRYLSCRSISYYCIEIYSEKWIVTLAPNIYSNGRKKHMQ